MPRYTIRRQWSGVFCVTALCLSSAGAFAADADKLAALESYWKLLSVELSGETRDIGEEVIWLIKGDRVLYSGQPLAKLANYPDSTPKGIDLAFLDPKQEYEGIYAVEQEALRICLNTQTSGAKERPFDFSTKDKAAWRVFTFQRIEATEAERTTAKGFVGIALGIEDDGKDGKEIVIASVLDKTPAEAAGLKAGDVLLSVKDQRPDDLMATVDLIRREKPGSELQVIVRRDGKEKSLVVKVGIFPFSLLGLLG